MLDYVIERLEATKNTWPAVAKGSGVSHRTIQKIAARVTPDPRVRKVQKLYDYFRAQDEAAAARLNDAGL